MPVAGAVTPSIPADNLYRRTSLLVGKWCSAVWASVGLWSVRTGDEAGGSGVARVHADCPDGCAHDLLLDQGGRLASDNSVARGVVLFDELKEAVMAAQAHALVLVVEL
jgi:hypothetical protein